MLSMQVKGMTCGHCVMAVTRAIKAVDASAEVKVDLEHGRVDVESQSPAAAISEAITEAGYEVVAAH